MEDRQDEYKLVDVAFDPDAEVIEQLLGRYQVSIFVNGMGSFSAMASYPNEKKSQVHDDRYTDDFTPARALARLAYKVVLKQVVAWTDRKRGPSDE